MNEKKYYLGTIITKEDVEMEVDSQTKLLKMISPEATVLECGPGGGAMTRYLKEVLHCTVYIIEFDPEYYRHAMLYSDGGVCANLEDDNWMDQFDDASFDYILYADVLEHLHDPQKVLSKMKRYLKPDGSALLSVPNVAHGDIIINLLCDQFMYTPTGLLDNTHVHLFARKSLHAMIHEAGYYLARETYVFAPLFSTGQGTLLQEVPEGLLKVMLENHTTWNVYQFICTLTLKETKTQSDIGLTEQKTSSAISYSVNDQIQDLTRQLSEIQNAYMVISNSTCWKMTKPLRVTLDMIKRLLKSNRYIYGVLKNIKTYGFSETLKQIKEYWQWKKHLKTLFEENLDFSDCQTDIKPIALYLPQFYAIKENDEWWGKGFTEWTNVKNGRPRFIGHYQPREPLEEFGYYNLSDIQTLKKQVALARQHGIYGFGIYYYWFSGRRLLEKPMDMLLEHPEIEFPFMAIWANHNWTRTWDGLEKNVLIEQKYLEDDPEKFIIDIKKYLDDKRYIRVDGKPVIGLYEPKSIPNVKEVLKRWRNAARKYGIGEILIWICIADINAEQLGIEDDIDGEYEFPPRGNYLLNGFDVPQQGVAYDYSSLIREGMLDMRSRKIPVYPGSMMHWDNSARRKHDYRCWIKCSPEKFYLWNQINVKYLREHLERDKRFLFVNAWNEWGEGTYLEPDKRYGYAYINALSKAIMDIPIEQDT